MSDEPYDPNVRLLLVQSLRLLHWSHGDLSAPYWRLYWNSRPGASVLLDGRAWTRRWTTSTSISSPDRPSIG